MSFAVFSKRRRDGGRMDRLSSSFLVTTSKAPVTSSVALVSTSFLVTTSKALATRSDALVPTCSGRGIGKPKRLPCRNLDSLLPSPQTQPPRLEQEKAENTWPPT